MNIEKMERKRNRVFERKRRKRDKIMKRNQKKAKGFEDKVVKVFIKAYSSGFNVIDLPSIRGFGAWWEVEQCDLRKLINKLSLLYQDFDFTVGITTIRFKKKD